MAATYIAKQYGGKSFTWAIAGRRGHALNAVREELTKIDTDLSTLSTIVVDSNDEGHYFHNLQIKSNGIVSCIRPYSCVEFNGI